MPRIGIVAGSRVLNRRRYLVLKYLRDLEILAMVGLDLDTF
jgi:hypothetical protein